MAAAAFTYDVATNIGRVRLYAGDVDGSNLNATGGDRTRTDAEVLFLLQQNGSDVRAAAAELLEGRAAEYAASATRTDQGHLRVDLTVRSTKCLEAAAALRMNVVSPVAQDAGDAVFTSGTAAGAAGTMDLW